MSAPTPSPIESGPRAAGPHASASTAVPAEAWLTEVRDAVVEALGAPPLALLLGGSHALGEGVWRTLDGRRIGLSDLDLWAVLPDESARRSAARHLEQATPALAGAVARCGIVAPVEVMLVTPVTLAALPARPATVELRARGRVLAGDPVWLTRVPAWDALAIPPEERLLLLENRAFELLWAHGERARGGPLSSARARHAVLKVAVDLATALALSQGELPLGAEARVAWGRARLASDRSLTPLTGCGLEALWAAALAWRAGTIAPGTADELAAEWRRAARAWVTVWRHLTGAGGADPFAHARRLAARAPWPRRVRRWLAFDDVDAAPPLFERLRTPARGTPPDRLYASAAVLLIAAAAGEEGDVLLGRSARHALRELAVTPATCDWSEAARALTHRWDAWVLGGRRGTVAA